MNVRSKPAVLGLLAAWFALIGALLIVYSCGCMPRVPYRESIPRVPSVQDRYAVLVESSCAIGGHFDAMPFMGSNTVGGSGVLIDGRHVVTAKHVVSCGHIPNVHITLADGRRRQVVVARELDDVDLALLELSSAEVLDVAPPQMALMPAVDQHVRSSAGWPQREGYSGTVRATFAKLECTPTRDGGQICYTADLALEVWLGNSGSGLYDDRGNLVGIIIGGSSRLMPDGSKIPAGDGYAIELLRYWSRVAP